VSEEFYTVERVAQRLSLHVKTVLRFIHEGRLRATRIGKQYRILRSDLESFAGAPLTARSVPPARVTSIVDIEDADAELAQRVAKSLSAARMGREAHVDKMRVDVVHDPARRHLKVVLVGSAADTATMLNFLQALL
jgi:excisionase family DNA binding protein